MEVALEASPESQAGLPSPWHYEPQLQPLPSIKEMAGRRRRQEETVFLITYSLHLLEYAVNKNVFISVLLKTVSGHREISTNRVIKPNLKRSGTI